MGGPESGPSRKWRRLLAGGSVRYLGTDIGNEVGSPALGISQHAQISTSHGPHISMPKVTTSATSSSSTHILLQVSAKTLSVSEFITNIVNLGQGPRSAFQLVRLGQVRP